MSFWVVLTKQGETTAMWQYGAAAGRTAFTVPVKQSTRLCSSGLSAIIHAHRAIQTGDGDLFIAGGVENMTAAPM